MDTSEYTVDINDQSEGFSPLLPAIAGIMENVQDVSVSDLQKHLEKETRGKILETQINDALRYGIKLGLFTLKREFKVRREFTTQELKKLKQIGDDISETGKIKNVMIGKDKRLAEYVKREREQRRSKLRRRRHRIDLSVDYPFDNELSKYLCHGCKKSLEKDLMRKSRNSDSSESIQNASYRTVSSNGSVNSFGGKRSKSKEPNTDENPKPEKSKLLIEKNPLETEPPYYDIFT